MTLGESHVSSKFRGCQWLSISLFTYFDPSPQMRFQLTGSRSQRHTGLIWIDGHQWWRSKCIDEVATFSFNMNFWMLFFGVGSSELSDIPRVPCDTDHSQLKVGLSYCYWVLGYPKMNSMFLVKKSSVATVGNPFSMTTSWWFDILFPFKYTWEMINPIGFKKFQGQGSSNTKLPNLFHVLFVKHKNKNSRKHHDTPIILLVVDLISYIQQNTRLLDGLWSVWLRAFRSCRDPRCQCLAQNTENTWWKRACNWDDCIESSGKTVMTCGKRFWWFRGT